MDATKNQADAGLGPAEDLCGKEQEHVSWGVPFSTLAPLTTGFLSIYFCTEKMDHFSLVMVGAC